MIWRSTILFLTSLTVVAVPAARLHAHELPVLMAQSPTVEPDAVIDTGQTTPDFSGSTSSPLQHTTSERQREEIKVLQQELKNRGYYNGPIDGIYGPITDQAVRELRGQQAGEAGLTPSLFPSADAETAAPTAEPNEPNNESEVQASDEADSENNSAVRINAENVPEESQEINIGDTVSPQTGSDVIEPSPTENSDFAQTEPSPGLGRLLWPGLALIAALGSFGIGFILANRVKSGAADNTDSSWGGVPDAVPASEHLTWPSTSQNGHTNGASAASTVVSSPNSQTSDSLSIVSTAANDMSGTTRLAKVDVVDELVANLELSDPSKRRKAIWELGQRGNSSAVHHLVNAMVDADSKEKSLILAALSEIGIRSLKPMSRALAIALQDDNPDVRKNAIRDLTRVYDLVTQISQMLGHATEDEDPEVRRTAEWALEQLNRIREAPKLKSSLNTLESARPAPELLSDEIENLKN